MRITLIVSSILVLAFCKANTQNFYPEKSNELTNAQYKIFMGNLEEAYLTEKYYWAGTEIANLKGPKEEAFKLVNLGIEKDNEVCWDIHDLFLMYKDTDFKNNLMKSDFSLFMEAHETCKSLLGVEAILKYEQKLEEDYKERLRRQEGLDSSKLDLNLISTLDQMYEDDQKYRVNLVEGLGEAEKSELMTQQETLDRINIRKMDSILIKGFPTVEQIGFDHAQTIWLVLHHEGRLKRRKHYQKILGKAYNDGLIGKGALDSYMKRTKMIELEQKE